MKNTFFILISFLIVSCEIITIGSPNSAPKEVINYNQNSSLGALYLFKTELDSNNISAAAQILAGLDGEILLAFEKYELYFDVDRIKRKIALKPITKLNRDTLNDNRMIYIIEFDYLTKVTFTTEKISDYWFITEYKY